MEVILVPRGGARNRSGPRPDPLSERSELRSYTLTALPRGGFEGEVPEFPIPAGEDESEEFRQRELDVWWDAWRTPQACAWSMEQWRWRIAAEYCRVAAAVELDPASSAALIGQLHRFRDQLGLTPAGLKENGWAIAAETAPIRVVPDPGEEVSRQRRRSREMSA